ncbi:ARM repeat-containing protein [Auriscalpium vulgare]|uniref:ARM repeat-containing protein n=1 Tax=Auriscalpium vulgare TaxID=40419 RepID=A0ACB8RPZ9_9AGAM|nr:ARM repeat-containing protein [Auriscalpium vulgare]
MASTADIAQALASTLNPDPNIRIAAELHLSELLTNPQSALSLSQLISVQDAEISIRQSASIVLRKYVKEHWSPFFSQFRGNAPPVEIKEHIRAAIFQALSDSNRKIRTLSAHTLSTIANSDWPDEYPDLLTSLIRLLGSGSPDSTHGAMQVFTDFIRSDLTEDQILPVMRELLPVLLAILGGNEQHSALTRSRTVSVFRQCVEALFMVKGQHPEAVKEASASVLPVWLDAFRTLLNIDPRQDVSGENWDGLAIRIEVFRTLDTIHTSFSRVLAPYLPDVLTAALTHLQALYPTFAQYYLADNASVPESSEGEPIELSRLAAPLIDFVSSVARGTKARAWFEAPGTLVALVNVLVKWAQMTKENEEDWAGDANLFVSQEDDETQAYSVRVAVFDLLASLLNNAPVLTISALQASVQTIVADSLQARQNGDADWWRALEGILAALGSQNEPILDSLEDEEGSGRPKPINIEQLLGEAIPSLLTLSDYPFIQGRCLVFASRYAKLLPAETSGQYLEAAVQVIESGETGIPFKISAVKAIQHFCQDIDDDALKPIVPRIARDLGPFLFQTTEDTLSLVLETLAVVVEVDDSSWLTADLARDLVLALLEVWTKNIKDPIFLSILTDLFSAIASSSTPGVYQTAVEQSLSKLAPAIGNTNAAESWIASSALDLVSSLARGAPDSGLGEGFFAAIAPQLFACLKVAEDRDVLQNGAALLTLVVRKDVSQLLAWSDASGASGLTNVLGVVARLLQNQDESGGLVVGDLIIHLLRRAGDGVLPVLPELLEAMLKRMQTAQTATFLQSLVIPFAFLIHTQRDAILDLVERVVVDGGRSGLDVLLNTWCENAETFQGFWPTRVSNLALCQLLLCERASLRALMVKGDIVVKPETRNVIMTRSKTKAAPVEFTSVPFPVKALKLLLHDLQSNGEAATMSANGGLAADLESDDGNSEWGDDAPDGGLMKDELAFLSDMIGVRGMSFDNDDVLEGSDDEDLKSDPISQIDLRTHLITFFRECNARDPGGFAGLVGQLNTEEMAVVQTVTGQLS